MSGKRGWVGIDLDGTLAEYHGWVNSTAIGDPIPQMVDRVKLMIASGWEVRIFTARVDAGAVARLDPAIDPSLVEIYRDVKLITKTIQDWTEKHIGVRLPVTCQKDYGMIALYDDRCIQVEPNSGRVLGLDFFLEKHLL